MSNRPLKTQGFAQGIFQQSSVQNHALDTVRYLSDGRMFAYSRAGAVALGAGKLTQNAVRVPNDSNRTIYAAAAIGATQVYITTGGAVTADFYKDGWMTVNNEAGEGYIYRVKSHPAGTTATLFQLHDPLRLAIGSAGCVTLTKNRQDLVLICPSTLTGVPVGVPPIVVDINYYFWNQVKGPCALLCDATTLVIGEEVAPSNATPGAVEAMIHATTFDTTVGVVMDIAAATEYALVNLAIPGY
jgi:hypothetical protein